MRRTLKVLLVFEVERALGAEDCEEAMHKDPSWVTEKNVLEALRANGHEVTLGPLREHPAELIALVEKAKPDVVWNSVEAFRGRRYYEAHIGSLLELLRVPYTGSGPMSLMLCRDKSMSKKIFAHHRIRTPPFLVSRLGRPVKRLPAALLPAFVKPLAEEGSVGIARESYAEDEAHALRRTAFIHEELGQDAIIERYVHGRELYAAILGSTPRLRALPTRELVFTRVPEGEPRFASFHAKWDLDYQRRWGIDSVFPADLGPKVEREVARVSKRVFRVLHMRGYGRVDLRLDGEQLYVIEGNPNPQIARGEDFAEAARKARIEYPRLIDSILSLALAWQLP